MITSDHLEGFVVAMIVAIFSAILIPTNKIDTFKEGMFKKGSTRAQTLGRRGALVRWKKYYKERAKRRN